jgi:hypothetical protein
MCIAAGRELRELLSAHNDLIAEVNTLRSQLGVPIENQPCPPSTAFLELMDVENQTYGEFPHGFASPPSLTESSEPQQSDPGTQRDVVEMPVPGLPIAPDLASPVRTSTQATQHILLDGPRDVVVPVEDWQTQQTPGQFIASSNVQGLTLTSDTDWLGGFDGSGLYVHIPLEDWPVDLLPWEEAGNTALQGYAGGFFVPFPKSGF